MPKGNNNFWKPRDLHSSVVHSNIPNSITLIYFEIAKLYRNLKEPGGMLWSWYFEYIVNCVLPLYVGHCYVRCPYCVLAGSWLEPGKWCPPHRPSPRGFSVRLGTHRCPRRSLCEQRTSELNLNPKTYGRARNHLSLLYPGTSWALNLHARKHVSIKL